MSGTWAVAEVPASAGRSWAYLSTPRAQVLINRAKPSDKRRINNRGSSFALPEDRRSSAADDTLV